MQTVEIKTNKDLKRFATLVGKSNLVVINEVILSKLFELELIGDDNDDCGLTIKEILERSEYDSWEFINSLYKSNQQSHDAMLTLLVINQLNDCQECGCEVEIESDSHGKYDWENKKCTHCDYADSNEPDWDTMPGGHDYY